MTEADINQAVIDEFRANGGTVGGPLEYVLVLLLHHVGRRSAAPRVTPLVYQPNGTCFVIFASNYGAPTDPDWFRNLVVYPETEIEVGSEKVHVVARVTDGAERSQLWTRQKEPMPNFAEYERQTIRQIPVVVLEPRHPL
jgi:deazaflavin-dependent oxidoreductase (nitroreductase family)